MRPASNDSRTSSKADSMSGQDPGQLVAKPSTNNAATWRMADSSSERRSTIFMIEPPLFLLLSLTRAYMLIKETGNDLVGDEPVSPLHQSMTLVLEAHVFDGYIPLAQGRHDLLGCHSSPGTFE